MKHISKGNTDLFDKILAETPDDIKRIAQLMLELEEERYFRKELPSYFREWCKSTGRSGSVLTGKSIHDFFKWLNHKK